MFQNLKKLLRTLQVNFPDLLEIKFSFMRFYRNSLKIPFEKDFNALRLFPDIQGLLYLDVGANRGQSTDAILLNTKNSYVQAFEPNLILVEKLEGYFGDNKRLEINKFGLGDKGETQGLCIPFYKKWMFDGLASFDEEEARDWLKWNILFYDEKHLSIQKRACEIKEMDDLGLNPFFIKLDVQGYELKALKGGEKTIKAHEPILLIELPGEAIANYLKGFGYKFYAFKQGRFVPGVKGIPNTFFMTESKSSLVKEYISAER